MVSHLGSPTGMSCELRVGDTPWQNILSVQPGYMAGIAHLYLRLYYQKELLEGWSSELCLKGKRIWTRAGGILVGLEDMIEILYDICQSAQMCWPS